MKWSRKTHSIEGALKDGESDEEGGKRVREKKTVCTPEHK